MTKPSKKKPSTTKPAAAAATVTLTAFAEMVGRSLPTVQAAIRRGMPTLGRQGREHHIELAPAIRWWIDDLQARHEAELAGVSDDPALQAARRRKLEAEASLREHELREKSGAWVEVTAVEERNAARTIAARERLLALPGTAVQRGMPADHEDLLIDLVHQALAELAERGRTT